METLTTASSLVRSIDLIAVEMVGRLEENFCDRAGCKNWIVGGLIIEFNSFFATNQASLFG